MRRWALTMVPALLYAVAVGPPVRGDVPTPVPPDQRGRSDAERSGFHDANSMRTVFWNFGMVGDYPNDPGNVDLSVFHSVEVPKGAGMNYSDGITPFVLAEVQQEDQTTVYIMETGFRERQGTSPKHNRIMRFEPRPGYFEPSPSRNPARSPACRTTRAPGRPPGPTGWMIRTTPVGVAAGTDTSESRSLRTRSPTP